MTVQAVNTTTNITNSSSTSNGLTEDQKLILMISVPSAAGLILLVIIIYCCCRNKKQKNEAKIENKQDINVDHNQNKINNIDIKSNKVEFDENKKVKSIHSQSQNDNSQVNEIQKKKMEKLRNSVYVKPEFNNYSISNQNNLSSTRDFLNVRDNSPVS